MPSKSAYADEAAQRLQLQAKESPYLAKNEDIKLGRIMKEGGPGASKARDRLIVSHMRLVIKEAAKYTWTGKAMSDLIMAGNVGLIRAADKYEPEKGFHFGTYASWWIRSEVQVFALASSDVTNVSFSVQRKLRKVAAAERELRKTGIEPTDELIAKRTNLKARSVHKLRQALESMRQPHVSVDDTIPGTDTSVGDTIEDPNSVDPDAVLEDESRAKMLAEVLLILNDRQRDIVQRRFGLGWYEAQTLEEVADHYGLTRERVRQIVVRSLELLAKGPHAKTLKTLLRHAS